MASLNSDQERLQQSVLDHVRTDYTTFRSEWTVEDALLDMRKNGIGERIVYFYVIDNQDRLVGVLPTRRLLTAEPETLLRDIMIGHVIFIPHEASLLEACEWFIMHKFLAFPVVDDERRILGILDVGVFAEEVFDIAERKRRDEVFEAIGFRFTQVRDASPLRAFRYRFPWLLATIAAGTLCAFIAGAHQVTLANTIVLAFFLTLILGLAEAVSVQSITVTIQALHSGRPSLRWYFGALRREAGAAILLGLASGVLVALIVWLWKGQPLPAFAIGGSIVLALFLACLLGLSVPSVMHTLKLDPRISSGPVTLALTDVFTILCYFGVAALVL